MAPPRIFEKFRERWNSKNMISKFRHLHAGGNFIAIPLSYLWILTLIVWMTLTKKFLLYHVLISIHLHPPQIRRPRWQNVPYLEIGDRATNVFAIHSNGRLLRCTSYPWVRFILKFFKIKFEFSTGAIWFEFFACTGQIFVLTSLSCFMIYLSNMIQNVCEILF